jgi:hypothetical protein
MIDMPAKAGVYLIPHTPTPLVLRFKRAMWEAEMSDNNFIAYRNDHAVTFETAEEAHRFIESRGDENQLWKFTTREEVEAAQLRQLDPALRLWRKFNSY